MSMANICSAPPTPLALSLTLPGAAKVPAEQSTHGVVGSPSSSIVPAAHGVQSEASAGAYVPLSHCEHAPDAPPAAAEPAAQGTHAVLGCSSSSVHPGGQSSQVLACSSAKVPASHSSHGVEGSASSSALPASQAAQSVAPSALYFPTAHTTQVSVAAPELPAGQLAPATLRCELHEKEVG